MANYLTSDTDLAAVADAIRTKGGTSGQLAFPQGFVDAIEDIEAGGGGIDLSDAAVPISQASLGGLFAAMQSGTWDTLELTVTSGTNPILIDFGRPIKGFVCYPKNKTPLSELAQAANVAVTVDIFADADENGEQGEQYFINRTKSDNSGMNKNIFPRVSSWSLTNGLLSIVPQWPSNASYHPLGFNQTYIFVYWWEVSA